MTPAFTPDQQLEGDDVQVQRLVADIRGGFSTTGGERPCFLALVDVEAVVRFALLRDRAGRNDLSKDQGPKPVPDFVQIAESIAPPHLVIDSDCWFSCPRSGECCAPFAEPAECWCGRDAVVVRIAEQLRQIWNARGTADAQAVESRIRELVAGEVVGAGIARHITDAVRKMDR